MQGASGRSRQGASGPCCGDLNPQSLSAPKDCAEQSHKTTGAALERNCRLSAHGQQLPAEQPLPIALPAVWRRSQSSIVQVYVPEVLQRLAVVASDVANADSMSAVHSVRLLSKVQQVLAADVFYRQSRTNLSLTVASSGPACATPAARQTSAHAFRVLRLSRPAGLSEFPYAGPTRHRLPRFWHACQDSRHVTIRLQLFVVLLVTPSSQLHFAAMTCRNSCSSISTLDREAPHASG